MNAGYPPFFDQWDLNVVYKIVEGRLRFPSTFSSSLMDLLKNLIQADLSKRYGNLKNGTEDIKSHKWFETTNFSAIYHKTLKAPFVPSITPVSERTFFDEEDLKNIGRWKWGRYEVFNEDFKDF